MENKVMKYKVLLSLLLLTVVFSAKGQQKKKSDWQVDKFRFTFNGSYNVITLRLSAVMNTGLVRGRCMPYKTPPA
jgi:hypothetical protein